MTDEQQLEQQLFELGDLMSPTSEFTAGVMERVERTSVAPVVDPVESPKTGTLWRRARALLAIVAVAAVVIWLRPASDAPDLTSNDWWLGSPAVYAQEITQTLQQARVDGIVFRTATRFILDDGTEQTSPTVRTAAVIHDRCRYESMTDGRLGMVTWAIPDQDGFLVTKYLVHDNSMSVRQASRDEGLGASPIARVLKISRLIEQADRRLEPTDIDGQQCIGFEIDAGKVHKKHKSGTYQIWLDTQTRHPVKMVYDRQVPPNPDSNIDRMITITHQFEWNPNLPDEIFMPTDNPEPLR